MRWNASEKGEMNVETIRLSLDRPGRFRIALHRYPPGTAFSGHTREARMYVLGGRCRVEHTGGRYILAANDVLDILPGAYRLEVHGQVDAEVVMVWPLPEAMWPTGE